MGQKNSEQTDEEIARLVQSGDIDLFGILVKRYEEKIKRYGRKFLSNFQDIEDIVQEIFIKAYKNIRSFDVRKKFPPWIYRIAHNEFVNAIRKESKSPLSFFDPDTLFPHPVSKENTDKQIGKEEFEQAINKCLDRLDPKYREPIVLYFFEDLSYKEIAEILHIPIGTVSVRLKRGKKIIRSIYQKSDYQI